MLRSMIYHAYWFQEGKYLVVDEQEDAAVTVGEEIPLSARRRLDMERGRAIGGLAAVGETLDDNSAGGKHARSGDRPHISYNEQVPSLSRVTRCAESPCRSPM
jgi:hypothetical protein